MGSDCAVSEECRVPRVVRNMRKGRVMVRRSVNEFAYAHARIRGRIGDMPGAREWQQIVNAGDLETTIETMSGAGLHYWVSDFPRHPSAGEIERACLVSLLGVLLFTARLIPERWTDTGQWLLQLPHVLQLRMVQSPDLEKKQLLPGSPFLSVIEMPAEQRYKVLKDSDYGAYLGQQAPPESCWAMQLERKLPLLDASERHAIARLRGLLEQHTRAMRADMAPAQIWMERSALFERLKALLAGDPFQVITLLIYAVLESIQFERVRAVLLLRAYKWPAQLLGGLN